jgi:hypothetical protein
MAAAPGGAGAGGGGGNGRGGGGGPPLPPKGGTPKKRRTGDPGTAKGLNELLRKANAHGARIEQLQQRVRATAQEILVFTGQAALDGVPSVNPPPGPGGADGQVPTGGVTNTSPQMGGGTAGDGEDENEDDMDGGGGGGGGASPKVPDGSNFGKAG